MSLPAACSRPAGRAPSSLSPRRIGSRPATTWSVLWSGRVEPSRRRSSTPTSSWRRALTTRLRVARSTTSLGSKLGGNTFGMWQTARRTRLALSEIVPREMAKQAHLTATSLSGPCGHSPLRPASKLGILIGESHVDELEVRQFWRRELPVRDVRPAACVSHAVLDHSASPRALIIAKNRAPEQNSGPGCQFGSQT